MGYCGWADSNERNKIYHDTEWGIPVHDDRKMFEHLMLECMQCGLSWDLLNYGKNRERYQLYAGNAAISLGAGGMRSGIV
ncbi:MAG: DNA-3-methyladenine glycosylase I [Lachnospiraceae bacterium]|nr:DNA-3-methyladenine glycosylase I [Lachnospiraceae bacterium]